MRIRLFSDLHLEFESYAPADKNADVIVLAGDIHVGVEGIEWAKKTFGDTPVVYVAGNHEYYRQTCPDHLHKMRQAARGSNVRFLENDAAEIDGVVFLGCTLWTDFDLFGNARDAMREAEAFMNDYRLITVNPGYRRLRPSDTLSWHQDSVRWLTRALDENRNKPVVIVTHHAPCFQSVPARFKTDLVSAAFASNLDDLVVSSEAKFWLHGHNHEAAAYTLGKTQVRGNPRGYPHETDTRFDPHPILEL